VSGPGEAVPDPESEIVSVGFEPSEITVTEPVAPLVDVGANLTLKLVLWPADKVIDDDAPTRVNPVPLIAMSAMVTLAAPEFVIVSESDLF